MLSSRLLFKIFIKVYLRKVSPLAMPESLLPIPLVFVSLVPPHHSFAMGLFVDEVPLVKLSEKLVVTRVLEGA